MTLNSAAHFAKTATATATAIGALALLGSCSNQKPAVSFNAPADVAAINRIEEVLSHEINLDKVMDYYAPDATVLDFYAPGIFKGRDQIRAGFAPVMASLQSMTGRMDEINVASDGQFACAAMQIHFDTK